MANKKSVDQEPDLEGFDFDASGVDAFVQEIKRTEIEQLGMMIWDYFQAYKMGDIQRMSRIFRILVAITSVKGGALPTLNSFFKGRRIGIYRDTVTPENAALWLAAVNDSLKKMGDPRVVPTQIE